MVAMTCSEMSHTIYLSWTETQNDSIHRDWEADLEGTPKATNVSF